MELVTWANDPGRGRCWKEAGGFISTIRGHMVSTDNNQAEDGIDGHTVTKEDRQFKTVL